MLIRSPRKGIELMDLFAVWAGNGSGFWFLVAQWAIPLHKNLTFWRGPPRDSGLKHQLVYQAVFRLRDECLKLEVQYGQELYQEGVQIDKRSELAPIWVDLLEAVGTDELLPQIIDEMWEPDENCNVHES